MYDLLSAVLQKNSVVASAAPGEGLRVEAAGGMLRDRTPPSPMPQSLTYRTPPIPLLQKPTYRIPPIPMLQLHRPILHRRLLRRKPCPKRRAWTAWQSSRTPMPRASVRPASRRRGSAFMIQFQPLAKCTIHNKYGKASVPNIRQSYLWHTTGNSRVRDSGRRRWPTHVESCRSSCCCPAARQLQSRPRSANVCWTTSEQVMSPCMQHSLRRLTLRRRLLRRKPCLRRQDWTV